MKTFIKKFLTICLLYVNTVVLTYSVHSTWRTYYMYNTLDLPSLDNVTHVFYARLCIFIPIAIITFVIGTYTLIKLTKHVVHNVKKEIRTVEEKKKLTEKHKKWQAYFNSIDAECDRYIYDSNGDCIGYIIDWNVTE